MKKDNSTLQSKVVLRKQMLTHMEHAPIVAETHGGMGGVFKACYSAFPAGMVIEKQSVKVDRLAKQRPSWSVYEGECNKIIRSGCGSHLVFDVWDIDPYGSPWDTIDAIFDSIRDGLRESPRTLWMVVNDGLKQKLQLNGGWDVKQMAPMIERFGNRLAPIYLDVCRELLQIKGEGAGYTLAAFAGYYTGHSEAMTHYLAKLNKVS